MRREGKGWAEGEGKKGRGWGEGGGKEGRGGARGVCTKVYVMLGVIKQVSTFWKLC